MLEIAFGVTGNGAADATGAEQESGLLEQGGADVGNGERAAGVLKKREQVEGGTGTFAGRWWRRGRFGPAVGGPLDSRLRDERPEHHQGGATCALARRNGRAVSEQPSQIEVTISDTVEPVADALA